jgi:SagB-type dehydrogenase family enzyme
MLTSAQLGQVLWAAQGVTGGTGLRTAPSAGGLYPLELYVVAGEVADFQPGIYQYQVDRHVLALSAAGDHRADLAAATLGQGWVALAPAIIVVAAAYGRTTAKYGDRGVRYVHMEAGHAAQNVCLQATAIGLGCVVVGLFDDREVKRLIGLPPRGGPGAAAPGTPSMKPLPWPEAVAGGTPLAVRPGQRVAMMPAGSPVSKTRRSATSGAMTAPTRF